MIEEKVGEEETTEETSEETPESESSTTEETETEETEETKEEELKVPLSRLRKSEDKRRSLETKLEEFETRLDDIKGDETPTDEKEKNARGYLEKMIKETLSRIKESEKKEEQAQDKIFKETLTEIKEIYPDLVKDDKKFLKFYEDGKFEDSADGLWGAAKIYSGMDKAGKTTKPRMPSSPRTSDKVKKTDVDVKKDLYQILDDAKKEAKETGQL